MYRYLATARMATVGYVADGVYVVFGYGLRLLRVLVLLALWRTILGPDGAGGMTTAAVLTYTLVAEVFREQLAVQTTMDNALWNGTVANYFLRPHPIVAGFAAETAGQWALDLAVFSLPLLLVSPLLGVDPRPASLANGLLFVVSLGLTISVGFAVELVFFGLLVVLEMNVWILRRVRAAIETVLAGSIVPLALLPWGLGAVFAWTPYAAMASAPLRIYTGTGDPLPLLLGQLAWSLVLWPLGGWLWGAHRERLAGYGG